MCGFHPEAEVPRSWVGESNSRLPPSRRFNPTQAASLVFSEGQVPRPATDAVDPWVSSSADTIRSELNMTGQRIAFSMQ